MIETPARYFVNGESLTYTLTIENTAIASGKIENGKAVFTGLAEGATPASIKASNGETHSFNITVRSRPTEAAGSNSPKKKPCCTKASYVTYWSCSGRAAALVAARPARGQFHIVPRERLDSMAQPALAHGAQAMRFDRTRIETGAIGEDDGPKSFVFTWRNTGDKPLVITRVKTTCGCAVRPAENGRSNPAKRTP